jgi:K+-sensing histidine kinase KdpD
LWQKNTKPNIEAMRDELLKIIIQELRSPISAIIGFTDILKEAQKATDSGLILDTISSASRRTKDLLDMALLVADTETTTINDQQRPCKISHLLEIAGGDLLALLQAKHITVNFPDHTELSEIIVYPDMIKQVLKIFLDMSIRQSPYHSTIHILIHEEVDHVELEIKHPCHEEGLQSLQTIKAYLKSGNPRKWQWPGIETAISKYIMDLHHAKINIHNNSDGEVSAKLIFPVNDAKGKDLHQLLSQMN